MAHLKKNPFTIVERPSTTLGIIYDVVDKKQNRLKSFISFEFANKYATQQFLQIQFDKAIRSGKPSGVSKDLKKEFGEDYVPELILV